MFRCSSSRKFVEEVTSSRKFVEEDCQGRSSRNIVEEDHQGRSSRKIVEEVGSSRKFFYKVGWADPLVITSLMNLLPQQSSSTIFLDDLPRQYSSTIFLHKLPCWSYFLDKLSRRTTSKHLFDKLTIDGHTIGLHSISVHTIGVHTLGIKTILTPKQHKYFLLEKNHPHLCLTNLRSSALPAKRLRAYK